MLDVVTHPLFSLVVSAVLTVAVPLVSKLRSRTSSGFLKFKDAPSAWRRAEFVSKLDGPAEDPLVRQASRGALFSALEAEAYAGVRSPCKRYVVLAAIYFIFGLFLLGYWLIDAPAQSGLWIINSGMGLVLMLMSLFWLKLSASHAYSNVVFSRRIRLLVERQDVLFLRDPVRRALSYGNTLTSERVMDALWVRGYYLLAAKKARQAGVLQNLVRSEFLEMRDLIAEDGGAEAGRLEGRVDELARRIDGWFVSQVEFRTPIGPKLNLFRMVRALKRRKVISVKRTLRS